MSDTTKAAPGWYPDLNSPGRYRWWDGSGWKEQVPPPLIANPQVVVVRSEKPRTNHVLHFILSVLTAGLWIPVWIAVATVNAYRGFERE